MKRRNPGKKGGWLKPGFRNRRPFPAPTRPKFNPQKNNVPLKKTDRFHERQMSSSSENEERHSLAGSASAVSVHSVIEDANEPVLESTVDNPGQETSPTDHIKTENSSSFLDYRIQLACLICLLVISMSLLCLTIVMLRNALKKRNRRAVEPMIAPPQGMPLEYQATAIVSDEPPSYQVSMSSNKIYMPLNSKTIPNE